MHRYGQLRSPVFSGSCLEGLKRSCQVIFPAPSRSSSLLGKKFCRERLRPRIAAFVCLLPVTTGLIALAYRYLGFLRYN